MSDRDPNSTTGRVWEAISYQPVMSSPFPEQLLTFLPTGARVLDAGCGVGVASRWLAQRSISVLGIDVNASAIQEAQAGAAHENVEANCTFRVSDILTESAGQFDAVMAIRVLTCFADASEWNELTNNLRAAVRPAGLLFVWDFLRDDASEEYAPRYADGLRRGWRLGAFDVPARSDSSHDAHFVAYHHNEADVLAIASGWPVLVYDRFISRSMRGHDVRAFVLIARRPGESAESAHASAASLKSFKKEHA